MCAAPASGDASGASASLVSVMPVNASATVSLPQVVHRMIEKHIFWTNYLVEAHEAANEADNLCSEIRCTPCSRASPPPTACFWLSVDFFSLRVSPYSSIPPAGRVLKLCATCLDGIHVQCLYYTVHVYSNILLHIITVVTLSLITRSVEYSTESGCICMQSTPRANDH